MKAVMYPFRRDDAIIGLASDFPELDWAVVASPEELGRQIVDADILVMGAYGHSRLQEFVFGGFTRHVLNNNTMPVLMFH